MASIVTYASRLRRRAGRSVLAFVSGRDHRVMARVNGWRPPRWVRAWMLCATRAGDGWLWWAIAICLLIFGGPHAARAVGAAGAAAGTGVACFLSLKKAFRRRRPGTLAEHSWADLLPPDQFSFPSGHSITAFAMAVSLGLFYPAWMGGLLFCALSIAASRVVLGMHFLSDVVVGSSIGALLGYGAFTVIG